MSGRPVAVQQALVNIEQIYTPELEYFFAVGTSVQSGQVLSQAVSKCQNLQFPANVYDLTATLDSYQNWSVS